MNYNRRRNIFTLGDFHQYSTPTKQIKAQHLRRQNYDPFERDPFKIQSYNFRYAERPVYPLQNLEKRLHSHNSSSSGKRFETFFYNYDFASSVHDKENPPSNKYRENRRRKFLQDNQQQQFQQKARQQLRPGHAHSRDRFDSVSEADCNGSVASGAAEIGTLLRPRQSRGGLFTDSASMCSVSGMRAPRRDNSSQTRHISGGEQTSAGGTASHLQAQENSMGRARSCSRSSLGLSRGLDHDRRMCSERLAAGNNSSSSNNNTNKNYDRKTATQSGPTASASYHARLPLQSSTQNMVTATVEPTHGTCSGCQININIKGLESQKSTDNLVIKIETDNNSPANGITVTSNSDQVSSSQNINSISNGASTSNDIAFAKIVEVNRNSDLAANMDLRNTYAPLIPLKQHRRQQELLNDQSSTTFIIDKRLSKFAIRSEERDRHHRDVLRSSSHSRVAPPRTMPPPDRLTAAMSTTALRPNSREMMNSVGRSVSKERVPTLLPWRPEAKPRPTTLIGNDTSAKSNFLRHIRPSYNTTLNEMRNLRRQQTTAAYAPSAPLRGNHNLGTTAGLLMGHTGSASAAYKAYGSTAKEDSRNSAGGQALKRRLSRMAMRGLQKSKSSITMNIQSRTDLGQATASQSHHSIKTMPLNVNINVFTDKLKLLRV